MAEYQKTHIIIHHSTGDDRVTRNWDDIRHDHITNRGFRDVGYHYGVELVGNNYEIQKGREELDRGAHCKEASMNYLGLGICLVGNFDKNDPPEGQLELAAALCADLCRRHDIPVANINPHSKYAINNMTGLPYKSCPGNNFDMDKFRARVRAILEPTKKEDNRMFKDVNPKMWYATSVEQAAKYGLMMGTGPGTFEPDRSVTRAELAAVAVRLYLATNEDFVEVVDKVIPAVVQVETTYGLGSGSIIHPEGYVLTNCHVISMLDEDTFTAAKTAGFRSATEPWTYAEGPVLAYDRQLDLALCKIELGEQFPTLPLARQWPVVKASQKVLAIGSPLGLIQSVAEGVVSAVRVMSLGYPGTLIQTETEINPGNSGGALVNLQGELVGVPSMKLQGVGIEGLNFAIALPTVQGFLREHAPVKVLAYLGLEV